ncbi:nucleotidyltransferase family protein [Alloacidobacterium dinghuense]|uniref:Nucleotidyltransferase family protein n=1 Tax=Alloacidobacterium dinghuense TaxID=2763107 RepID=A0A7G8BLV1_9BACT|nr:nucleotidyltransferase family protein [Alloacidobacterium dinghuense]QNI33521.1 nucleotidyltransferase family protein [Alloacidobacterium dinghuense]
MPAVSESCDLLRAIARSAKADEIYQLAAGVRDWDSLLKRAEEHRVLPLVFSRLADMGSAAPAITQERLRAEYHRNVFHCLANAAELIAVLQAFDGERIPAMPFKGVALAASIYGDLTMRSAGDLDVLIRYCDLARATAVLQKRGFELRTDVLADGAPAMPDHYEFQFERQSDGMFIELRWRLQLSQPNNRRVPRFGHALGLDWVQQRARTTTLAGAEVLDMNPETALLVLCMHGSKHVWSRLAWICDVAQLLRVSPDLDWNEVIREAKELGLWRALALGILVAHRVAGASVPQPTLQDFEADAVVCKLARHIQESLFVAPGSTPKGGVPYDIRLLGLRDRARLIGSLDWLRPGHRDIAVFPLPKALYPLYYLIRPFRLLFDRSAR